jgi:hypothetical protein
MQIELANAKAAEQLVQMLDWLIAEVPQDRILIESLQAAINRAKIIAEWQTQFEPLAPSTSLKLEQAAMAAHDEAVKWRGYLWPSAPWERLNEAHKERWRAVVRVSIEAMGMRL